MSRHLGRDLGRTQRFWLEAWFDAVRDGWVVTVWFTNGQPPDEEDRFLTLAETLSRADALAKARTLAETIRGCDYDAVVMPVRARLFEDSAEDVRAAIASRVNSLPMCEKEVANALLSIVDPMQRLGLVMAMEARA